MTTNVVHRRPRPTSTPSSSGTKAPATKSSGSKTSSGKTSKTSLFGKASSAGRTGGHRLLTGHNPRTGQRGRYSLVVTVEYLACMVMVALSGGGVGADQSAPKLADPAVVLVRLTAVSALFFVLALLSAGERVGKLAAAFGGLVTLGVAFNAVGEWQAIAQVFGGAPAPSQQPVSANAAEGPAAAASQQPTSANAAAGPGA